MVPGAYAATRSAFSVVTADGRADSTRPPLLRSVARCVLLSIVVCIAVVPVVCIVAAAPPPSARSAVLLA